MYITWTTLFLSFITATTASPFPKSQQQPLHSTYRIPTVHESAVQARRILSLENIGTLSTIFPEEADGTLAETKNRPQSVGGLAIGLMNYYADCEPERADPTLLAITISTSFKNVAAGSNITMSLRWHPPHLKHYGAVSLPRFSLMGYLEDIPAAQVKEKRIKKCFVKTHPDARYWTPGNDIHESRWSRLVVQEIYWIGGFGDRAYIGWIPVEEWKSVTKKEIESIRLPGETRMRSRILLTNNKRQSYITL